MPRTINAVDDEPWSGVVATFQDSTPGTVASDYIATIDWGQVNYGYMSSSQGVIESLGNGRFAVRGSFTYSIEANPIVNISINRFEGPSIVTGSAANVYGAKPIFFGTGVPLTQVELTSVTLDESTDGTSSGGPGYTPFGNPNNGATGPSNFTATVDWGDGTPLTTAIWERDSSSGNSGWYEHPNTDRYRLRGSHTYTTSGDFEIRTTISPVNQDLLDDYSFVTHRGYSLTFATASPIVTLPDDFQTDRRRGEYSSPHSVLENDINKFASFGDAELTAYLMSPPAHGVLQLSSDGNFSYTPNNGFLGTDTFTYRASNGEYNSNSATVSILVANHVPVANNDFGLDVHHTRPSTLTIKNNDFDADGDLTQVVVVTPAQHGTLVPRVDGTVRYYPEVGYLGPDAFQYKLWDGDDYSNIASVTMQVTNTPLSAPNLQLSIPHDRPFTRTIPATDSDGDPLQMRVKSLPAIGLLKLEGQSWTYTPKALFTGSDSFTYSYFDGVEESPTATISIAVVNYAPVATATAVSDTEIDLTWPSVINATSYRVERMTNFSPWTQIATPTTNSFNDTGLSEGQAHYYRLLAILGGWVSPSSSMVYAITPPKAPTGLAVTFVNGGKANLTWTDHSSIEIRYSVEQWINGDWQQVETAAPSTGTMNVSVTRVFNPSTAYSFRVRAYENDFIGNHVYSQPSSDTETTANWPAAPMDLAATAASETEIDLSWLDTLGETGYKIERSVDGNTWTQIDTAVANATTYNDTSVTQGEGTLRYYRVQATTSGTDSAYTNVSYAITMPATPTGLTASIVNGSRVDLAWTDWSGIETSYSVEQWDNVSSQWHEVQTSAADTESLSVLGTFDPNIQYKFRVRAYDADLDIYSAPSNEAPATALGWPTAPTNLTTIVDSNTKIDLTWTDNAMNEFGYNVELTTDGENWTLLTPTPLPANTQSYQITGLTDGTLYGYRVQAVNAVGGSGYAFNVDATLPTAPANLQTTVVSGTQIDLTWNAAPYATGYSIWLRAELDSDWTLVTNSVSSSQTSYAVTGLAAGGVYYAFCVTPPIAPLVRPLPMSIPQP